MSPGLEGCLDCLRAEDFPFLPFVPLLGYLGTDSFLCLAAKYYRFSVYVYVCRFMSIYIYVYIICIYIYM